MNITIRSREEGDQLILNAFFEHPEVSKQLWLPSNAESWISESRKSLDPAYRSKIMVDGKRYYGSGNPMAYEQRYGHLPK